MVTTQVCGIADVRGIFELGSPIAPAISSGEFRLENALHISYSLQIRYTDVHRS